MRTQTQKSFFFLTLLVATTTTTSLPSPHPTPSPWPDRFHALLFMNLTGFNAQLQITNLWYDWPAGRNVNMIQKQLGPLIHDVEWNNGTSFYYSAAPESCRTEAFGVGIPRPGFMEGATYLGRWWTDGFLCDVWEKVDFIWYYEDVVSRRPVRWDFSDGGIFTHVITFEEGAVLEELQWQAPSYCFSKAGEEGSRGLEGTNMDVLPVSNLRSLSF